MSFAWQIVGWQNSGWQDFAVTVICLAAAIYVARAAWRAIAGRKSAGCGASCGKCSTEQPKRVLSIEQPHVDAKR
jgi:hypothetical protein